MVRKFTQQSLASWIFGGVSFLFLIGVFLLAPPDLPEAKHRLLGFFAALCASFLGYFLTGAIAIDGNVALAPWGKFSIKAGGGLALFILILLWWNSDESPSKVRKEVTQVGEKVTAVGEMVKTEADRQRKQMDDLLKAVAELKSRPKQQRLADEEIWAQAQQDVATKNGIPLEKLQEGVNLFIAAVKADPNADFLDRARALFAEKQFSASAAYAGRAAETREEKYRAAEKLATLAQAELKSRSTEVLEARKHQGLACVANENFDQAVEAYGAAMKVITKTSAPEIWAELQFLLGNASASWAAVSVGPAIAQRLREAVGAYREALDVCTSEALPQQWALIQNSLAAVLQTQASMSEGRERARLLGEAVKCYGRALEVYTRETLPERWAMIQNNLAGALYAQASGSEGGEQQRLLGEAVNAFRLTLDIYTRDGRPREWAMIQKNMATVLCAQALGTEGDERARLLGAAVKYYKLSLEIYTREASPKQWAVAQNNLATTLELQASATEGREHTRLLGEAVNCYRSALEIHTREVSPQMWAISQNNLATALSRLASKSEGGEQARLFNEAMRAHRLALEVRTRDALPLEWAMTQNNLATMLRELASTSDGDEKLRLLTESENGYRLALQVYTREALPHDWARTQNNLAWTLRQRATVSEGSERIRLLNEAVRALRNSIQVFGLSQPHLRTLADFLGAYSYHLLFSERPQEATVAAEEALTLVPGEHQIAIIQAYGYLLAGHFSTAEAIFRRYEKVKLKDGRLFTDAALNEFSKLREAGVNHPYMARIEEVLKAASETWPKSEQPGAAHGERPASGSDAKKGR